MFNPSDLGCFYSDLSFEVSRWMGVKDVGVSMCTHDPGHVQLVLNLSVLLVLEIQVILEVSDILNHSFMFVVGSFLIITQIIIFLSC